MFDCNIDERMLSSIRFQFSVYSVMLSLLNSVKSHCQFGFRRHWCPRFLRQKPTRHCCIDSGYHMCENVESKRVGGSKKVILFKILRGLLYLKNNVNRTMHIEQ